MKVAQEAGLTKKLSRLLLPILRHLFIGLDENSKAYEYISMNLAANFLGLGNAATPLGILAMKELDKENQFGTSASSNMIVFVVLNTASLQLIPTTTAALRLKNGSAAPMDILPAVWMASAASIFAAVLVAIICRKVSERRACRK